MAGPTSNAADAIARSGLTDQQVQVLEWDLYRHSREAPDDGQPQTLQDMADHIGISRQTLHTWMTSDKYRAAYEVAARHILASPDRLMIIAERLWSLATNKKNPDRQALNDYWKLINEIAPSEPLKREQADVTEMSDGDLLDLITDCALLRGWSVEVRNADGQMIDRV